MTTTPSTWPVQLPATPTDFAAVVGDELIEAENREPIIRENPAHGVAVSRYPRATAEDVERAIRAARDAADRRVWSGMSGAARAKILLDVARRIEADLDEFRRIECLECGKPVANVER